MPTTSARLVVREISGTQWVEELSRTPFNLGRLSTNDLQLQDKHISRHHARIIQDSRGYVLEDTGSLLGTYVNGQKITSCVLKAGDQIKLGVSDTYTLYFEAGPELPNLLERLSEPLQTPTPQLHHLSLLLQMAESLHRAPGLEHVMTTLVDAALQLADADRGLLFLRDDSGELRLRLARGRGGVFLSSQLADYSRSVLEQVARFRREEVSLERESTGETARETAVVDVGVRGVVALPLQKFPLVDTRSETLQGTRPELLGVLYLDSRTRAGALTSLDRKVLQSLAVEGATVIENARLFRLAREQERIRHELAVARNIQEGLLPRTLPSGPFFQLQALTMPCETVGGDYYDVIRLREQRIGVVVADVSGKGLTAALLSACLQGAFSAVAAGDPDLASLFYQVNDFLCEKSSSEMFATVFYGILDPQGRFEFVNAGHVTPLVVRAQGPVVRLDPSNFPLGLFPGVTFAVDRVELEPGDLVLIFSDGVTEARNAEEEFLGEERLKSFLEGCRGQSAEDVSAKVIGEVSHFAGAAPRADDLTLTVLRYGPS